jgi:hypothetical protein
MMDGVDFCGSVFLFLIPHFSFFVFLTVFLALFSSFYSFFLLLLLSSRIPEAWRIVYIIVRYASNKNSSSFGNFTFLLAAESKTLVTYVHPSNTSGLVISGDKVLKIIPKILYKLAKGLETGIQLPQGALNGGVVRTSSLPT